MRIAVIGSGIAGLASAWWLDGEHDVTLFEANDYLGGHTHTHEVTVDGRRMAVDTGFIVFNPHHYPLLSALFDELGVDSQPTTMSFSMHSERSGVEYNATSLDGLFCQRRNLLSPRFWGMLADLRRFYRDAPLLLGEEQYERFQRHEVSVQDVQALVEAYGRDSGMFPGEGSASTSS